MNLCDNCGQPYTSAKYKDGHWLCEECLGYKITYSEFIPERIRDERKKNFNSLLQPYRSGELSKEYVEAYPNQVRGMLKDGTVTKDQVKKSRYVWKDLDGFKTRGSSK